MELLIGERADKHSTLNVFDFLKHRKKPFLVISETLTDTLTNVAFTLSVKKSFLTYSLKVFVHVLSGVAHCFYSF